MNSFQLGGLPQEAILTLRSQQILDPVAGPPGLLFFFTFPNFFGSQEEKETSKHRVPVRPCKGDLAQGSFLISARW